MTRADGVGCALAGAAGTLADVPPIAPAPRGSVLPFVVAVLVVASLAVAVLVLRARTRRGPPGQAR